jgi:hypothetical protein
MIVRLDHDTGAQGETSLATGDLSPFDLAQGLLALIPSLVQVAVWEDGRSPLHDNPAVTFGRDSEEAKIPVDEAIADRVAEILARDLADLPPEPEQTEGAVNRESRYPGASRLRASTQQSVSGNFLPPV